MDCREECEAFYFELRRKKSSVVVHGSLSSIDAASGLNLKNTIVDLLRIFTFLQLHKRNQKG